MRITHHPDDSTLLAHAAGRLNRAARVVLATHLASCPQCRETVRLCEAIGGALLEALPPTPMAADSLAHALARLELPAVKPVNAPHPWMLAEGLPCPPSLRDFTPGRWRAMLPGISRIQLLPPNAGEGSLYLLRIAPGKRMPKHGHTARELTCVLAGAYCDGLGEFGPGDLSEADAAHDHQPVSAPGGDCICLIASDAKLRFEGRVARLLQPLAGV
ncbi:anti-sigma factor [Acidocella aquatica]|uniref:Anti-sigma factor n=1 Tax=Acidocella aquatica TaxID=1922313 RepID=A0ABQ6A5S8_9PROT|nr:ChrR family anti-sigma-E factor [Acidocella aquatica]GLR67013.1 anti-sigma factor [Acidocella aquatica]